MISDMIALAVGFCQSHRNSTVFVKATHVGSSDPIPHIGISAGCVAHDISGKSY